MKCQSVGRSHPHSLTHTFLLLFSEVRNIKLFLLFPVMFRQLAAKGTQRGQKSVTNVQGGKVRKKKKINNKVSLSFLFYPTIVRRNYEFIIWKFCRLLKFRFFLLPILFL